MMNHNTEEDLNAIVVEENTPIHDENTNNSVDDEVVVVTTDNIDLEIPEENARKDLDITEEEIKVTSTCSISDKIADVLADGWKTRVSEARKLVVDEIADITNEDISTDEKFITALEDGSLLCKLAQSLSDKCGLNIKIKLSKRTPNGKSRMKQQNFSRFSRFCRAINIQKSNVPSIQDLSSGRLKPIVNCLCDIKRLRDDNSFQVYAATWEAFSTPTKSVSSPAIMMSNGSSMSNKPQTNSILRVLRQSSMYGTSMVAGFLSSPSSSGFFNTGGGTNKANAKARTPIQNNTGAINMNTLASLSKVEAKAKLNQDNKVLEDKLHAAMLEIENLKTLVKSKDNEMALIKKECEDCVLGLDKKNNELQEATKTVNASVTVLESKDDELSNLREKYKDLLIKFEDASKTVANKHSAKVEELQYALKSSETTVDNLVVELSETKMRESSLAGQVTSLSRKLETFERKFNENKAELEDQKFEHEKFKIDLTTKTAKTKAGILKLKTNCKNVTSAYKALANEVNQEFTSLRHDFTNIAKLFMQKCKKADVERKELVENYEREIDSRRKVFNELQRLRGNIRVLCRVRPIDTYSDEVNTIGFSDHGNNKMSITTNLKGAREKRFEYDRVFQPRESQSAVYKEVSPMVQSSMDGFHSCIFAYGQTGSGKTYTMQGPANDPGVYTRSLEELFKIKEQRKATHEYTLTVSMVEIYNESIRDLLIPTDSAPNNNVLEIRKSKEGGNYLPNANLMNVESQDDIVKMMKIGEHNRSVGATKANEHSSRSHCLLLITIVGEEIESGAKMNGKLVLVDLAGSERVGKTDASGDRLREAKNINKSLSALGNVINALSNKQGHIPFRDSKLTYLLQNSLSKDNKVLMIAQVSPALSNYQESVCSLEFAGRARGVELGRAKANVKNMELPKLQEQLKKTKDQLYEKENKLREFVSVRRKLKQIEEENASLKDKIGNILDSTTSSKNEMKEMSNAISKASEKSSRFERELKEKDDKMQQQKQKIDTYQSRLCKAEQRVEQLENELTIKQRELREQKTIAGSARSSAKKPRPNSSRKRKSASPLAIRPLNSNIRSSARKSTKSSTTKSGGILKSSNSSSNKRVKRVNFNNENDVLEISRNEEDDVPSNTKSSTPRNLRTSSRVRAKFNSSSSNNNENASTKESTRAKELEEWKRKKASITRSRRVGLLGGATRIKQTGSSSRRTTTKSKTVGSRTSTRSTRSTRTSTRTSRWN
jgi:kinesin family protein C2/C3